MKQMAAIQTGHAHEQQHLSSPVDPPPDTGSHDVATPSSVGIESEDNIPCFTNNDMFRVLYAVSMAEMIKRRGLGGIKYMEMARLERSSVTNEHFREPIKALLKIVLPFRSLDVDDFAVVATLAWSGFSGLRGRAEKKLWSRVEQLRAGMNAEQLALVHKLKKGGLYESDEDGEPGTA
jgi:hypothetical protein